MNNSTQQDLLVITNLLDKSISDLIKLDKHLFQTKSGELTFNHRLAIYVEQNLTVDYKDFNVDCEYLRDSTRQDNRKEANGKKPVPDIIIHKRGNNFPTNYLFIEAKRFKKTEADETKIISFLENNDYQYKFGANIVYLANKEYVVYDLYYCEDDKLKLINRFVSK